MSYQHSGKFTHHVGQALLFVIFGMLQACSSPAVDSPPAMVTPSPVSVTITPSSALRVDFDALQPYIHPSQRFSAEYPADWEVVERSDGVIFLEPNNRAGYSVFFEDAGQIYTEEDLNHYLVTFVARNFFDETADFHPISQTTEPDGAVVAQFSTIDPNLGPTTSELRLFQTDTIIFIVHVSAPEENWAAYGGQLQALANKFTPLDTDSDLATVQPTTEPEWTLIGPKSQEFGFVYANDWDILEQQENSIAVGHKDTGMMFTASKFSWPNAAIDPQAAEKAATEHIETLSKTVENMQSLPPKPFPVADVTGATIDFLYTDDQGRDIAGSVITAVNKGQMHKIVFTAPADIYEAALVWFNPMQRSFTFLAPDKIETKEP
ncbi:MAG TPA: hypothetical protein P5526_06765 [Anaerolineae bacterium]|nr:hypothetical protein [Anaerolineae bacterium]HRV91846.1 hypothetical protein [Anaerolineae bacterium]